MHEEQWETCLTNLFSLFKWIRAFEQRKILRRKNIAKNYQVSEVVESPDQHVLKITLLHNLDEKRREYQKCDDRFLDFRR